MPVGPSRNEWNFLPERGQLGGAQKKRLTEKRMAPDDESTGLLKDLRAVYDSVARYRRT